MLNRAKLNLVLSGHAFLNLMPNRRFLTITGDQELAKIFLERYGVFLGLSHFCPDLLLDKH